ncbi:MAG TPA: PQQ-dependent sugar dehydrogenase [Woeseiaceae bacterium]
MRSLALLLILLLVHVAQAAPRVETIADGLEFPWSIAFLPDGAMLVTERSGRLRIVRDGKLLPDAVAGVPEVLVGGQGGLLDVVLDPAFAENQTIYLSFSFGTTARNATRVVSARFDGTSLSDLRVLFTASPFKKGMGHFGGRMAFLPDGTLLLTTGEGFDYRESAQSLGSHLGKTIRINPDGSVPLDNPFFSDDRALPEIFSYGHRNPQAILVSPADGSILQHEHGPRGGDELNRIVAGRNYGWPVVTYGRDYSGARISPFETYPGMEPPLLHWTPSIAPAGMTLYDGALFPEWRGDLFVAALAERSIRRIDLDNGTIVGQEVLFDDLGERMRDVRTGPDGALYVLTDSTDGRILRIVPETPRP